MDASLIIAAGKKYKEIVAEQMKEEKEAHEDQLRRMSYVYNEEKQKLDLTMKLQQARQRQTLQRKLFDRKAQKGYQRRLRNDHRHRGTLLCYTFPEINQRYRHGWQWDHRIHRV